MKFHHKIPQHNSSMVINMIIMKTMNRFDALILIYQQNSQNVKCINIHAATIQFFVLR